MSTNSDSDGQTTTLGARVNFFDSETGEFDLDRQPGDPTTHRHGHDQGAADAADELPSIADMLDRNPEAEVAGVNRDQWVAGSILRTHGNPTLYCPDCWPEPKVPLSDPEHHLPHAECLRVWDDDAAEWVQEVIKHDHRRHRACPRCGTISFGGVLADRPTEEFLGVVDAVLDALDLPSSTRGSLREGAAARKADEHWQKGDEANLTQLIREYRYGTQ